MLWIYVNLRIWKSAETSIPRLFHDDGQSESGFSCEAGFRISPPFFYWLSLRVDHARDEMASSFAGGFLHKNGAGADTLLLRHREVETFTAALYWMIWTFGVYVKKCFSIILCSALD